MEKPATGFEAWDSADAYTVGRRVIPAFTVKPVLSGTWT
jgi:hypothetical protein